MRKTIYILMMAVLLAGGAVTGMSTPSQAQGYYVYTTAPPDAYAQPWVGPSTPWIYYNGDWFLNGILYYFFGPQYGWAPYYAYPPTYIVRPERFYAPFYLTWFRGHPNYYQNFQQEYPYWRGHRQGRRYDEKFFEQHQHGQAGEWQKGFHGHPAVPTRPGGQQPGPGPAHVTPPAGQAPAGPTHVAPAPGQRPESPAAPTHVAPPAAPKPAPAPKAAPAPPAKTAPGAAQPEKGGQGEEKH